MKKANTVKNGAFGNPKIYHEEIIPRMPPYRKKDVVKLIESSVMKPYRKVISERMV